MVIRWIKDLAGVKAGAIKSLPEGLANRLIAKGVVEAVRTAAETPRTTKVEQVTAPAAKGAKTARKAAKKSSK